MTDLYITVEKLLESTLAGKIKWEKLTDALIWKTTMFRNGFDIKTNIILINIKSDSKIREVLFRIYDLGKKITLFEINTGNIENEEKKMLLDLYDAANKNFQYPDSDVLTDLFRNIP